MFIVVFRTLILYIFIIFAFRFMGKRQIGELQPYELVVTILISELAANPVQNTAVPLVTGLVPILVLVSMEIVTSGLSLISRKIRSLVSGNTVTIIRNGVLDQEAMWKLRFSVDDVMEELRKQEVFDLREVEYAVVETSGNISIYKKVEKQNITAEMMNVPTVPSTPAIVVLANGQVIQEGLELIGRNEKWLNKTLNKEKYQKEEVFIMTSNNIGDYYIIAKNAVKQ